MGWFSAILGKSTICSVHSDLSRVLILIRVFLCIFSFIDRSRDVPLNHHFTNSQHHQHTNTNIHHNHNHQTTAPINTNSHSNVQHHHQHQHQHHQQQLLASGTIVGSTLNCDDLDCFFCEQIATHIEHKRSAANSNMNFDMGESPTRKRGRFY